jgi:hypothetical protein
MAKTLLVDRELDERHIVNRLGLATAGLGDDANLNDLSTIKAVICFGWTLPRSAGVREARSSGSTPLSSPADREYVQHDAE